MNSFNKIKFNINNIVHVILFTQICGSYSFNADSERLSLERDFTRQDTLGGLPLLSESWPLYTFTIGLSVDRSRTNPIRWLSGLARYRLSHDGHNVALRGRNTSHRRASSVEKSRVIFRHNCEPRAINLDFLLRTVIDGGRRRDNNSTVGNSGRISCPYSYKRFLQR